MLTRLIASLLYAAIPVTYPDYLEPDDEGERSQAFYARCQMYYIAAGGE